MRGGRRVPPAVRRMFRDRAFRELADFCGPGCPKFRIRRIARMIEAGCLRLGARSARSLKSLSFFDCLEPNEATDFEGQLRVKLAHLDLRQYPRFRMIFDVIQVCRFTPVEIAKVARTGVDRLIARARRVAFQCERTACAARRKAQVFDSDYLGDGEAVVQFRELYIRRPACLFGLSEPQSRVRARCGFAWDHQGWNLAAYRASRRTFGR